MPFQIKKCEVCGEEKKNLSVHMRKHQTKDKPDVPKESLSVTPEWLKKVDDALNFVLGMKTDIDDLKKKISPTATDQIQKAIDEATPSVQMPPPNVIVQGGTPEYKCHPRHKQLADEILGSQFTVWESYDGVLSTHFQFNIKVPDVISPLKGQMPDIRTKAIMNAEGENGVRDWLMLVRKNLNKYYSENALQSPFVNVT